MTLQAPTADDAGRMALYCTLKHSRSGRRDERYDV